MSAPQDNTKLHIPFCKPDYGIAERDAIEAAIKSGKLEGGGQMNRKCETYLQNYLQVPRALITPSCTASLEMMALILDLAPGDEIIMPSFTFVSTANAFALRGLVPVFTDIDPKTFNLCPTQAARAITPRTRAIMLVHYAGVGCDMDAFEELAKEHNLILLEDAAQAIGCKWNGRALGSIGAMGAFSFHHTKNLTCGEGGALIVNQSAYKKPAEFIRDKGTDRSDFLKGDIGKYEWQRLGSSYLLSELAAAVLSEQLNRMEELNASRLKVWEKYDQALSSFDDLKTPFIPPQAKHNGHIYSLCFRTKSERNGCVAHMKAQGIIAAPHYVPLHLTPGGQRFGRANGALAITLKVTQTQIRLPIYSSMSDIEQSYVITHMLDYIASL